MSGDEIVTLALSIKNEFDTADVLKICGKLDIQISYTTLNPNIYQAFTIKSGAKPLIVLNSYFTLKSQNVLCAHELGHALIHDKKLLNQFNDNNNGNEEYEANLFAVTLLFNQNDLCMDLLLMDNYLLKYLLDTNIKQVF